MRSHTPATRVFHLLLTVAFVFNLISPVLAQEVDLKLPPPSKIKAVSKPFAPAIIRAVTVNPNDPFLFDFIIDKGDSNLDAQAFEDETQKLVKYFLAALTIPENDLWVNLSPYEQDSMVPRVLGVTEMGKDLLIADYYLKQVGAALTNPNTETGKKFWDLAYAKAKELYGTTKVPINTFSKVWIVPDQAVVLEKDGSAFVADSRLKVYLDQDYVAIKKNLDNKEIGTDKIGSDKAQDINAFSAQIIKEVVLPEIEKEVNSGENFALVRQIYSSAILASWYKKRLKESLLGRLYADQNKVAGVNAEDMDSGDKIFEKYTAALKTGAYNIIKQDFDLSTQKIVQRKYFSGGVKMAVSSAITYAQAGTAIPASAQLQLTEIAKSIGNNGNIGTPTASSASPNIVVATVSLRQSAPTVVAASSNAIATKTLSDGRVVSAPTALTATDERVIRGLEAISSEAVNLIYSNADRGVVVSARGAIGETLRNNPTATPQQIAQLPAVQRVLELSRTDSSLAVSLGQYAPEIPLSGFLALAQATRNEDGSFNETRFNNYVSNFNASKGAAPISVSQQQDLRAAVVAVQSSLSSLSGQQTPVTLMAESLRNPTVSAGLNVLSTNRNFAAEVQLNAGDRATNTAVSEYVSTVGAVRTMSAQDISKIAQSTNVSEADQAAITTEIAQPNFATMSTAEQMMQSAPTLTRVAATNSDFSYAVSVEASAKANPPVAITSLSTNDYYSGFLAMPDTEMENRITRFLQSQGRNAEQAENEAKRFVETFSSLRRNDLSKEALKNVDNLRFAASREGNSQKKADITAAADIFQAVERAGKLNEVVGDYASKTVADQQIRQVALRSRGEFIASVRKSAPAIPSQRVGEAYDAMQSVVTDNPSALKSSGDFGRAIHQVTKATPNSLNTTRENLQIISLASAPTVVRSSLSLTTVDYIRNLFAPNVDNAQLERSVFSALPDSRYTPKQKQDLAAGLNALKEQAKNDENFALQISFAENVARFKQIVDQSGNLNREQKDAFKNLSEQDVKNVGGIDLSAERMDLKIKRDGKGIVLPVADQDLQNLKIDGLSPVILNVQPATPASVPFLMNLGNSAQAK